MLRLAIPKDSQPANNMFNQIIFDVEACMGKQKVPQRNGNGVELCNEWNTLTLERGSRMTKRDLEKIMFDFENREVSIDYVWNVFSNDFRLLQIQNNQLLNRDNPAWEKMMNEDFERREKEEHRGYIDRTEKKNGFFSFFRY